MNLSRRLPRLILLAVVLVGLSLLYRPAKSPVESVDVGSSAPFALNLRPPAFVQVAGAAALSQDADTGFLGKEAGIAAYVNAGKELSLSSMRSLFTTIEAETDEYLVGSVTPPDYGGEFWDVHVYARKDGWVTAYYLKDEPAAKIVDWDHYDGGKTIKTLLENVLEVVLGVAGTRVKDVGYYDFRYPEATNLLIIGEYNSSDRTTDSFTFQIPEEVVLHEGSWLFAGYALDYPSYWSFDDSRIIKEVDSCNGCWQRWYGVFTPAQLRVGLDHEAHLYLDRFSSDGHAALFIALTYSGAGE